MKKMFSFLGTTPYMECLYFKDDFTSSRTRFIQTALYEMLKKEGVQIDKVYVFVTDEARRKNYEDYHDKKNDIQYIGLKNVWETKFGNENVELIPVQMEMSLMKELKTLPNESVTSKFEEEQWDLFNKIFDIIETDDEIYFDITHSFRSNPVIALIIAHFAKTMKNAKLKRLFYGNFESLGQAREVADIPVEERRAPIVDITSMMELLDWTIGVDTFLRTGNPAQIYDLARDKGRIYQNEPSYRSMRGFSKALHEFNLHVETVRGLEIHEKTSKMLELYPKLVENKTGMFPQFEKLTTKIDEKLEILAENEWENMMGTVRWAYEHGLYQQSITLLTEYIVTIVARKYGLDELDVDERILISGLLKQTIREIRTAKENSSNNRKLKDKKHIDTEKIQQVIKEFVEQYPEVYPFEGLIDFRNDINHAGMRKESISATNVRKTIKKYIKELEPFFKRLIAEEKHD